MRLEGHILVPNRARQKMNPRMECATGVSHSSVENFQNPLPNNASLQGKHEEVMKKKKKNRHHLVEYLFTFYIQIQEVDTGKEKREYVSHTRSRITYTMEERERYHKWIFQDRFLAMSTQVESIVDNIIGEAAGGLPNR